MTSLTNNYARYVLSNLLDALDQPYRLPDVEASGLMRLSLGVLESVPGIKPEERTQLRDGYVPDPELAHRIYGYADAALSDTRFAHTDLDLIRALLYLQRDDLRIKSRVMKYLRCEDLSSFDRKVLGDLVPRSGEEEPLRVITQLGQLMQVMQNMPLVLCVDQLEDMVDLSGDVKDHAARFRQAIDTLVAIADRLPSSVVVISCLEDYYASCRQFLTKPKLDRLENDPEPVRLAGHRTLEEIEALVGRRLEYLYEEQDVPYDAHSPTFPFKRTHLTPLTGLRTRDVLDFCRRHREKCINQGHWVEPGVTPPTPPPPPPPSPEFEQAWNDFHAAFQAAVPDDEDRLAQLLAWAIRQCSEEMPNGYFFTGEAEGRMIPVETHRPDNAVDRLLVALCEKGAQGGGLGRQITEVENQAGEVPAAVVRSTAFPSNPKTVVSKQIGKLISHGGRRVVVENADWRRMLAFRSFYEKHHSDPGFASWRRESRPMSELPSLRQVLALDRLLKSHPGIKSPPAVQNGGQPTRPAPTSTPAPVSVTPPGNNSTGPLLLGTKTGVAGGAVTMEPKELTQHSAFLGGSGSGKTTAALNIIEQLLERGVPAVLLDRKGDLCRYADPAAWESPLADAEQAARRRRLRESLDVAVFTPGQPTGRRLAIRAVPDGLSQMQTLDREQLAGYAAAALAGMMGYKPKGTDQTRLAILRKAIEVLGGIPDSKVTIPDLRTLIEDRDEALLSAVGGFEDRQYKKLGDDLLTLWLNNQQLLTGEAEQLDIDLLLGQGVHARPGKTRLSIISTRFLSDSTTTDFWVAQLLITLGQWIGKHPAAQLQAVFLFDEADQYLPAVRQPATKAPLENLLKRARAAGVGLMLATQSPGDLDYKCRDTIRAWFVGRVKEQVALNKLRPMFANGKVDVAAKLPTQGTGQFYLLREKDVCSLQGRPSLITTEQLPEERIAELAASTRKQAVA
jgi:hypothetical protein